MSKKGFDMRAATLRILMAVGLLNGVTGLYGIACANPADNPDRNGRNAQNGNCLPADDDGNPCTIEGCKGSAQEHILLAGLPCGSGGSLKCDASGQCTGCSTADQCGELKDCASWTCNNQVCTLSYTADNTPLAQQQPGDCKERQCDGQGGEKEVPKDDDAPVVA